VSAPIAYEKGGELLIIAGCPDQSWQTLFAGQNRFLTVLVRSDQQKYFSDLPSVELWSVSRLGLRGFLALIRRISWRRFDRVVDPWPESFGFLRYWVWPRPNWVLAENPADLVVDLRENSPKH
jgi:hypothetical protein